MENLLYYIELAEDINISEYDKFLKLLSDEKQAKIQKFKFDIDKKLSIISDLFVRYLACKILNKNNNELIFSSNSFGKPFLDQFSDFHYNISHTRNAVVVGTAERPLGVDVEKIKPIDIRIAERFFCDNELKYIINNNENQERAFYEIWTKKEAYIKFIGKGLSMPLGTFDTTDVSIGKMMSTGEISGYVISACCEIDFNQVKIKELTEKQAYETFLDFALIL